MENAYGTLGVGRDATEKQITKVYKGLMRQYHPDLNKSPEALDMSQRVNAAYDILSDADKRAILDRSLDNPTLENKVAQYESDCPLNNPKTKGETLYSDIFRTTTFATALSPVFAIPLSCWILDGILGAHGVLTVAGQVGGIAAFKYITNNADDYSKFVAEKFYDLHKMIYPHIKPMVDMAGE